MKLSLSFKITVLALFVLSIPLVTLAGPTQDPPTQSIDANFYSLSAGPLRIAGDGSITNNTAVDNPGTPLIDETRVNITDAVQVNGKLMTAGQVINVNGAGGMTINVDGNNVSAGGLTITSCSNFGLFDGQCSVFPFGDGGLRIDSATGGIDLRSQTGGITNSYAGITTKVTDPDGLEVTAHVKAAGGVGLFSTMQNWTTAAANSTGSLTVNCTMANPNVAAVSCGYWDPSGTLDTTSIRLNGASSCTGSYKNSTAVAQTFYVYARCFNPNA